MHFGLKHISRPSKRHAKRKGSASGHWVRKTFKKVGTEHGLKTRMASLGTWPRGVTVSTLDSESNDRGSNPREAFQESEVPLKGPASKENVAKKLT